MNDLTKMRYSPRVMEQPCSRCGALAYRRCKSPRGDDANAHYDRLTAAGYVLNRETKEWSRGDRTETTGGGSGGN